MSVIITVVLWYVTVVSIAIMTVANMICSAAMMTVMKLVLVKFA